MAAKKVKVKVKKKKINFKRIFLALLIIGIFSLSVAYFVHIPVKNIYITGNSIVSDKEIIELSELTDYPPYINTYFIDIKKNISKNDYIKNTSIKRKMLNKIYIEVEEYKPLAIYDNDLLLSSGKKVNNIYNIDYIPYIINNIDDIYDDFITSFSKVDDNVLLKISHIEYVPNEVDNQRFILYMVDGNYTYITLSKIEKINKYNLIVKELEGKKGIIYLDSGDYVEIKGWHKLTLII